MPALAESSRTLDGKAAYQTAEAKAKFSELVGRARDGEEIIILHGHDPVARLMPLGPKPRRRPGRLRAMIGDQAADALTAALEAPLPADEQRILEGEGTDDAGIWIGLPEDRQGSGGR